MFWIQYPNLTFDETTHSYFWHNRPVIGVTTVLSSVGVKTEKDGAEIWKPVGFDDRWIRSNIGSRFGSAFHKIPAIIFKGGIPSYPDEMQPYVTQLQRFLREYPLVQLDDGKGNGLYEYPMYSEKYGYAGTLDWAALAKGGKEVWLIDWKTSSTTMPIHADYQTAAYEQLLREVFGMRIKIVRKTVRITHDNYFIRTRENKPEDWSKFQSCLNVYKMAA